MILNTRFNPSQKVVYCNMVVEIDGIYVKRNGEYIYHVKPKNGSNMKAKEHELSLRDCDK